MVAYISYFLNYREYMCEYICTLKFIYITCTCYNISSVYFDIYITYLEDFSRVQFCGIGDLHPVVITLLYIFYITLP